MSARPLNEDTKVSVTLAKIGSIVAAIVLATWTIRGYMAEQLQAQRETAQEISALRLEIVAMRSEFVSQQQMERFTANMRYENKDKGVIVPDPRQFAIR